MNERDMTLEERAREFVAASFGPFGVDQEPYVKIFTELMEGAVQEAIADWQASSEEYRLDAEELRTALKSALPHLDNSDSPGGCDGRQYGCDHCAAIRLVRAALARRSGEHG